MHTWQSNIFSVHQAGMLSVRKKIWYVREELFSDCNFSCSHWQGWTGSHCHCTLWRVASEKIIIHTFLTLSVTGRPHQMTHLYYECQPRVCQRLMFASVTISWGKIWILFLVVFFNTSVNCREFCKCCASRPENLNKNLTIRKQKVGACCLEMFHAQK